MKAEQKHRAVNSEFDKENIKGVKHDHLENNRPYKVIIRGSSKTKKKESEGQLVESKKRELHKNIKTPEPRKYIRTALLFDMHGKYLFYLRIE